ncbi:hypothetical protein P175DRAFT_0559234 [Aspergillus ochraceoroseus IBT 24754]|uniref:Major facilitator superfamily (MFS) profile domain-containing protein n=2 Tax=Aspergillus ochraceoroseus TaxID=138278 RepID=A0A2T5LTR1_9EURO|nr:uncharacterized protein P175DRAFT_0559234 [Aspergillus ochraceoroseus IBT 24754]KKK12524.1 hypothetical protein AOCH_000068 [Aspergillus ochraceoroseus]PTU19674.1 hypothetical protein P175DRAFT_0559234 [Aspergillus ochraceoroseus IBT 24754]
MFAYHGSTRKITRPFLLERRSSKGFIIFVVVFAAFTDMLLYGRIVPVTPTALHERVGLSEGDEMDINLVLGGPLDESVRDQPENAVRKEKRNSALYTLLAADRILVSVWAYFILSVILTSFDSVLPLFVEETFHWKQTAQGLIFIPLTVPHVFDPLVGYINDRYEEARRYLAAGAFFGAVPVLVLLRLVTDNSMHQKILLCTLLAPLGICLAIIITPVMVEASYVVKEKEEETPDVFGKGGAMALAYIWSAEFRLRSGWACWPLPCWVYPE